MASQFHFGAHAKIAAGAEISLYGVNGAAITPGAGDMLPHDWSWNFTKAHVEKAVGQIGLNGEKMIPFVVGESINGSLSGNGYFNSMPIWVLVAACLGEEIVAGIGDPYTHTFDFGENFYNLENTSGGTLNRHATIAVDISDVNGYTIQGFKPSAVEFTFSRDEGMKINAEGSGYLCTLSSINSSTWTTGYATNAALMADIILMSNACTCSFLIGEYSASKALVAGDAIRPTAFSIRFDQANDNVADSASGMGPREPLWSPTGRKVTVNWTQEFGNDDATYGRRDWTAAMGSGATPTITTLCARIQISMSGDEDIHFKFPKLWLTGPGIPIIDGPDLIGMSYSAEGYIPNETMTNDFAGMDSVAGRVVLINAQAGTYLQVTA